MASECHSAFALQVLSRAKTVGERVAIVGAGGIGFDVAEFLAHRADTLPPPSPPSAALEVSPLDPSTAMSPL